MYIIFELSNGRNVLTNSISYEEALADAGSDAGVRDVVENLVNMVYKFPQFTYLRIDETIYNPANVVSAKIAKHEEFSERFPDLPWPHLQDL
jgi:hypothetical protein